MSEGNVRFPLPDVWLLFFILCQGKM